LSLILQPNIFSLENSLEISNCRIISCKRFMFFWAHTQEFGTTC
jgi:hypothetical protein